MFNMKHKIINFKWKETFGKKTKTMSILIRESSDIDYTSYIPESNHYGFIHPSFKTQIYRP